MTELPRNKADQYFKTTKQQLYYTRNNVKVCLSDYSGDMHPVIPVICTQFGG
jgi:hypothetical protein